MRWAKTAAGLFVPMSAFAAAWEWMGFPGCCPEEFESCLDCYSGTLPDELIATMTGLGDRGDPFGCDNCDAFNKPWVISKLGICSWAYGETRVDECSPHGQGQEEDINVWAGIQLLDAAEHECRLAASFFIRNPYWEPWIEETYWFYSASFTGPIDTIAHALEFDHCEDWNGDPVTCRECVGSSAAVTLAEVA